MNCKGNTKIPDSSLIHEMTKRTPKRNLIVSSSSSAAAGRGAAAAGRGAAAAAAAKIRNEGDGRDEALHYPQCCRKYLQGFQEISGSWPPPKEFFIKLIGKEMKIDDFNKYLTQLENCLPMIRHFIWKHHYKLNLIQEIPELLPLPTLYLLNSHQITNFRNYARHKINKDPELIQYIRDSRAFLFHLMMSGGSNNDHHHHHLLAGILNLMVGHSFPINPEYRMNPSTHFPNLLLDSLFQSLLDRLDHLEAAADSTLDILGILQSSHFLELNQIQSCLSHVLKLFLTYRPSIKSSYAVQNQGEWIVRNQNGSRFKLITRSFCTIIASLEPIEASGLLKRILSRHEINWKSTLSFVSVFVVCHRGSGGDQLLKATIVDPLLNTAFEENSKEDLLAAFLVARQISLENDNNDNNENNALFSAYSSWFSSKFASENSPTKHSRNNFIFLIEFLTSLVPFESGWALQGHLSRPPSIPSSSSSTSTAFKTSLKSILQDYCILARTRLKDIEEKGQSLLLKVEIPKEIAIEVDKDIEKSIQSLEETSKLPQKLLQASIFRKPYFNGYFIPRLLTTTTSKTSSKLRLIKELVNKGKISDNLLNEFNKMNE